MKQFFKMMFASVFGTMIAIGLFFLLSIFILIGIAGSMGSTSTYVPTSNTVYKIELNGSIMDNATENPFAALMGETNKALSLTTLIESIEAAKNNANIAGIYLDASSLSTGSANLQALRRALIDFKESGKFLVAYADSYTQGCYYLCSVADKVFMNPAGMLGITGIASQSLFFKGLMDKVGVNMEIFKVGTYKGYVEPFMLDKLSDANREQIQSYASSIWNTLAAGMAESRKLSADAVNAFANEGLIYGAAELAVERGFVDELKYRSEVEAYVKELAGQTDEKLKTVGVDKMKNIKKTEKKYADQIAVLYAEGEITEESAAMYDTDARITGKLADELIRLKDNDDVKAVVLRVNSPGGSAYISEQIWRQVIELKKTKPIVVSMGSMAASGGYYISCAATKIIAESNTLTGSIGVFGTFPIYGEVMKKVGVSSDVVKTNTYADMGDISRSFREDERALMQGYVERIYDLFLTRCADGRGVTKEEIDVIGQGRVWTGEQALERGLVDELGGLDKAVQVAAELAEVSDYGIMQVTGSKDMWTEFIEKQLGEMKMGLLKSTLGEELEYVKQLQQIRSVSGVQARLPYDVKPM